MNKGEFYALLEQRGIPHESYEHPAVFTMEELAGCNIPHTERIVKNLFLRDDKKRNYYLVTVAGEHTVNLAQLSQRIPSRKLSFASEEKLWELLALKKGHVTPVGILNNGEKNVTLVLDQKLVGQTIGIHPMENTATVFLAFEELLKLVEEHGNTTVICRLDG
ncbi:prolyl-tRNA synthetase associated domain-containing protein [Oscillospiraceae bacterium MB08-C2-2]|nr:prolyl-tRNA synthetase associated domain-containing protein [Oscillospiraceae bacterium MB08-C2-2]